MPSLKYFDPASQTYKYIVGAPTADPLSGFRNVIRNGDFSIAQRGVGPYTTAGYTLDGWYRSHFGNDTLSLTRIEMPIPESNQTQGATHYARLVVNGGATAGSASSLREYSEGVRTFAGRAATLSFWACSSSGTNKLGVSLNQYFGASGSPDVDVNVTTFSIDAVWRRYTVTFTFPSIVGKTIGTVGDAIGIYFWTSSSTTNAALAGNPGVQNWTLNITDIQLEEGTVATPFERIPVQQQLAWCQRYFQRIGTSNPNAPPPAQYFYFATARMISATQAGCVLTYPSMRVTPSIASSAPGTFSVATDAHHVGTAISVDGASATSAAAWVTTTGLTFGQVGHLNAFGTALAYIDLSAEL